MYRASIAATALVLATSLAACSDSPARPDPVTSLAITLDESFTVIGDTVRLPVRIEGGSEANVEWDSLDPQVATVAGGVVTGAGRGMARIVARAGGLADTAVVGVLRNAFNVSSTDFCENPEMAPVRVAAFGARSIILADQRIPAGVYSANDYRNFAVQYDESVHPTVTGAFGELLDRDGTGRFIVLFTPAVNEMTEDPQEGFVGGFVWARDLFPRTAGRVLGVQFPACPGSNEAEMTYLAIPDPTWPEPIRDYLRRTALGTIAHELQHAINASRRIFVHGSLPEEVWLNEGMSHAAEEMMFYRAAGLGPGQAIRLDDLTGSQAVLNAVNRFQIGNLVNIGLYLEEPETESALAQFEEVGLETRGAAWNLLRYSADRRGGSQTVFWDRLMNTPTLGAATVERAIEGDLLPWMRDWAVSLHGVGGGGATEPRYRQASWNLRSVLPGLFGDFPLDPIPLHDGAALSLPVRAASAAYLRLSVASGAVGEVTVATAGHAPGACAGVEPMVLAIGGVYAGGAGTGETLCLAGGAGVLAEYVVVPFHASLVPGANLVVQATASGVATAAAPAAAAQRGPSRAFRVDLGPLLARQTGPPSAHERHLSMRDRERAELARRLPGLRPAFRMEAAAVASPEQGPLMVSVIRTR
jgi:hypothetical protein